MKIIVRCRQSTIEIRFNMDSLHGVFTKAQLKNISVNDDGYIFSPVDSSFYIYTRGNNAVLTS